MNRRPMTSRQFEICGQIIRLNVPADPEDILADAVAGDSADPYWGKIWDSAPFAACCVMRSRWPRGTVAMELGCGCGLLGIAALYSGIELAFSDHEPEAVDLAVSNARLNGFQAQGVVLDWNEPVSASCELLLASDVLYESELHQPLLITAEKLLVGGGTFQLGDPGREQAKSFLQLAMNSDWKVEIFDEQLRPMLTPTTNQFQWLVLSR